MEHLAILNRKLKLLPKILNGEKTIESRWYKFRKDPYKRILPNETIYFKNSGEPVTVKARVKDVLFFDNLNDARIRDILEKYGRQIGVGISYADELFGKRYCTLIFLKDIGSVNPFNIDKKGYGNMAAWITVALIEQIKRDHL